MTPPESASIQNSAEVFNGRLGRSIDFLLNMQDKIRERKVEGTEHLDEIQPGESVVIAVSHSTGFDIPLVIDAIDGRIDIAVADQSTHHQFGREHSAFFGQKVAGSQNFLPVSYSWDGDRKVADQFTPGDAVPMVESLDRGKSVLIAAHNPLLVNEKNEAVTPKPGYLAAYVAGLSGRRVLPVGVDYEPVEGSTKYDSVVRIGAPFELEGLASARGIDELVKKRKEGELTPEESRELTSQLKHLRHDGGRIFGSVQILQRLELGYPVLDNARTDAKLGKKALSSPTGSSFPKLHK